MNYSVFDHDGIVDEIADGAYRALHLLHRHLVNLPGRKILHHDLAVLTILATDGPVPASVLAERLSLTRPQITQFIDRLESEGAVSRKSDDRDRRRVRVEITDRGRSILADYRRTVRSHVAEKLAELGPGQAEALAQVLAQIIEITQKLAREGTDDD